jgi:hypothetical protein
MQVVAGAQGRGTSSATGRGGTATSRRRPRRAKAPPLRHGAQPVADRRAAGRANGGRGAEQAATFGGGARWNWRSRSMRCQGRLSPRGGSHGIVCQGGEIVFSAATYFPPNPLLPIFVCLREGTRERLSRK